MDVEVSSPNILTVGLVMAVRSPAWLLWRGLCIFSWHGFSAVRSYASGRAAIWCFHFCLSTGRSDKLRTKAALHITSLIILITLVGTFSLYFGYSCCLFCYHPLVFTQLRFTPTVRSMGVHVHVHYT